MNQKEKGAVDGLMIALLAVAVVAVVGIGWVWHKGGIVASGPSELAVSDAGVPNTGGSASSTDYSFVIASSTSASSDTQDSAASQSGTHTETRTVTTYKTETVPTHSAFSGVSGAAYHNSTYGLTLRLPSAGWTTYTTAGGPAGLPGTAEIHFVAPGESSDAFVVNVWGKPGWNYVRTQENFVHLNTTDIGEGTYVGENFTWIYSANIYSHAAEAEAALSGAVFY